VPQCVEYKVWAGDDESNVVSSGYALTGADVDWTVKVGEQASLTKRRAQR
jgi:hypothetical protein